MKRRRSECSAAKVTKSRRTQADALALGQLDKHLGYFRRRLQIWVFQDFIETLKPVKIRPAQYSVLLVIEANPGRSQATIGEQLGIERARLARILHELERRNWVARRANGSDRRSHSLYLTADGEQALIEIKDLAKQHEARLDDLLGWRRRQQLMQALRQFG